MSNQQAKELVQRYWVLRQDIEELTHRGYIKQRCFLTLRTDLTRLFFQINAIIPAQVWDELIGMPQAE